MQQGVIRLVRRPWSAALILLLVCGTLTLVNDSRGLLSTDTGIKVATLRVMDQHHTLTPDLGYWAAPWDPDATLHPFRDTHRVGDAYVDVSTLPMLLAAYPLWVVGGYRLTLLWPILGLLACALLARSFARRLRPDDPADGMTAFWLVGLASPLLVYSLDLWEHTLGVAAMGAAVLALFDAVDSPRWWRGLAAGALFGAAFAMRTEALVYTAVSFVVISVVLLKRRRLRDTVVLGAGGVVAFAALVVANAALEVAVVGESIRSSRAGVAAGDAASGLTLRMQESIVTSLSPFPAFDAGYLVAAAVGALALVGVAWWGAKRPTRPVAVTAAAVAFLVVIYRVSYGPGFWPGLLATTPIAAVALARGWRDPRARLLVLIAVASMPLVFLFQFPGGALPQWGGRYLLCSGYLLLVVGATRLRELERWARIAFVGLAVGVTACGLVWMGIRTHQAGESGEVLRTLPDEVLIFRDSFVSREFASTYGDKDWLGATTPANLDRAVGVVRNSGRRSFALVVQGPLAGPPPTVPGFHVTGTRTVPFIDPVELTIVSYAADP